MSYSGQIPQNKLYLLLEQADIVDEVSDDVTYLGFFDKNKDETTEYADGGCRIMKITTAGTITTRKWANGNRTKFNLAWDDRATYDYTVFYK